MPARDLKMFESVHVRKTVMENNVRRALAEISKIGPEHFEYESEFLKRVGIGNGQITAVREQFSAHVVLAPTIGKERRNAKYVWFGNPKAAARARAAAAKD